MKKSKLLVLVCLLLLVMVFALSCGNTPSDTDTSTDSEVIENETFTVTFSQGDGYSDVVKTVEKGATLTDIPTPKKVTGYTLTWEDKDLTDIQGNIVVNVVKKAIKYNVNYVLNGGTNNEDNIVKYDIETSFTFLKPTKNDSQFKGWFSDESLTDRVTCIELGTTEDITVYAKWEDKEKITVTFNANGGSEVASQDVIKGEKVKEPTQPTKAGYTFDGWYLGSDKWSFFGFAVTEKITLVANWIANENTLIFDGSGNTSGGMNNMTVNTNAGIVLPYNTYIKDGYTFKGWSTTKNGNVEYEDKANYQVGTESTYTLYAVWEANKNTLKFDANGGIGEMVDIVISTDETKALPNSTFVKDGYIFKGWSTTQNGEVEYANGADYKMGANSEYTLYAVWEANANKLIFDANGGIGEMVDIVISTDETKALPNSTFVKDGYTFKGWSTTQNGEVEYANGADYKMGANSEYTLYAVWEANENTLKFNANGGIGEMADVAIVTGETKALPNNAFKKDGYTFKGWSTTKDGEVEYENGANYTATKDGENILYAVWEANKNTVKFDGGGQTSGTVDSIIASTDEKITLPSNAYEKVGYTFKGWTDNKNTYNVGDTYTVTPNAINTLYAVWEANTNKLIFDANGGNGEMSQLEMKTDETKSLPKNLFVMAQHMFVGWSTTKDGSVIYRDGDSYKMGPENSYTLYAIWVRVEVIDTVSKTMEAYRGNTVNVLATTWINSGEAVAPWAQVELCVNDWDYSANGFGYTINNGVMERNEYIEDTYGIDINWVNSQVPSVTNILLSAQMSGYETYHVVLPRVYEAMNLVTSDLLYNLRSNYIDFEADYFNQEAIEQYTLGGKTFFVGGDISFLDKYSSQVIFMNNDMAEDFGDMFPNLHKATLDGNWTIDTMYDLAGSFGKNLDGTNENTDYDMYGFGTNDISTFYQFFGTYQVGKGKDSSGGEVFKITIENENVNAIIDKMLHIKNNPNWARTYWTNGYLAIEEAFNENRILFYQEVMQKIHTFNSDLNYSVLPFPKLSTQQDRYYVPFATQGTIACVPRVTDDRTLSECMITLLSKTAKDYITPAYIETIRDDINADNVDDTMEVIEKEIFPNLMYDLGYTYGRYKGDGGGLLTSSVQSESIYGNTNDFKLALALARTQAEKQLSDWSTAYNLYQD